MNNEFPRCLSKFFQCYLPGSRNVSVNTIRSYRDTFTEFLAYLRDVRSVAPSSVGFRDIGRDAVEGFLSYLETVRGCGISTRNQRLAGIKSFFRYAAVECPDILSVCHDVLSMRCKKSPKPVISYLGTDEVKLLLEQPDTSIRKGRRDLALLSLMYDSAARVQEICDIPADCIRLAAPPVARLYGKGRKAREVPLSAPCAAILAKYISENRLDRKEAAGYPLFFNSRKEKLSRSGVSYILAKYVSMANANGGNIPKRITPHCLRHSKAMHMVEAGINLIYIRDFLGHESVETTQVYARANPEAKRMALAKMEEGRPKIEMPDWNEDPNIMEFLHRL